MQPKHRILTEVLGTVDYDWFQIIRENRGRKDSGGVKKSKIAELQRMIDDGTFVPEMDQARVTPDGRVIDGAHYITTMRQNKMEVRYVIVKDERFGTDVPKREFINNILNVNRIDTTWTKQDIFKAALVTKSPLAVAFQDLMDKHGTFTWMDLLALVTQDDNYFMGRIKSADLMTFADKNLVEKFESREFKTEFNYFLKLNNKVRGVAFSKRIALKSAYSVIFKGKTIIPNMNRFRDAILTMDDHIFTSKSIGQKMEKMIKAMVDRYNEKVPKDERVNHQAVMMEVRTKGLNGSGKVLAMKIKSHTNGNANFQGKFSTMRNRELASV